MWSGSATTGYDSTGYGNWVKLTYSSNTAYQVLYGHLQQTGFSGTATANVTVIGYSGNTGGCPNGEARKSPQGFAFKNMWTVNSQYPNAGSSIYDGACYGGHP